MASSRLHTPQKLGRGSVIHYRKLTYVENRDKVTYMEKTQIYLRKEELDALRKAAARSGRRVATAIPAKT